MISFEGLVMSNKPLTNLEILDAVRKLKIPRFRGVFVRDNLPVEPKRMECGILTSTTRLETEHTGWRGMGTTVKTIISTATAFSRLMN